MLPPEHYKSRPQTWAKHYFLETYLEEVAFRIGYFRPDFVFVDGFSGPWKAEDAELRDTSFSIAIEKLQKVSEALSNCGRSPRIRCLFVEQSPKSFRSLEEAVRDRTGIETRAINSTFEESIPQILEYAGQSFALIFIDPTAWNVSMETIRPLLKRNRTEVIINFMYDFVNRFTKSPDDQILNTFDDFFGSKEWRGILAHAENREEAAIGFYCDQVRRSGGLEFVVWTKILKVFADRTYFHLVYGTRNLMGLRVFREVESKLIDRQDEVRLSFQQERRINKFGQGELYGPTEAIKQNVASEGERAKRLDQAENKLTACLVKKGAITFESILRELLPIPQISEKDVRDLLVALERRSLLTVHGRTGRKTKPEDDWTYAWRR